MAVITAQATRAMQNKVEYSLAVEPGERPAESSVAAAATIEEKKMGTIDIPVAFPCEKRMATGIVNLQTAATAERRMNGRVPKFAAASENWREKREKKSTHRRELHRGNFLPKEDPTKKPDWRWNGETPQAAHQREENEKSCLDGLNRPKGGDFITSQAPAHFTCYVKMLISNQLAGMVIGNTGQEVKRLKEVTGAKIVLSPHGMYFPGTSERLVSAEGTERAVFQVVDWIIDRVHELAKTRSAMIEENQTHGRRLGNAAAAAEGSGIAGAGAPGTAPPTPSGTNPNINASCLPSSALLSCKLCVPRAVVGSLIGRKGDYIQSVRVATEASINISPLFVTADEACAERIITIESPRLQSLRTAAFTIARKINSHPEKATCKHVCYYRKLDFEPSPLALIEENRRDRLNSVFARPEFRTATAESQPRTSSAEDESYLDSQESWPRSVSFARQDVLSFNQLQERFCGDKAIKMISANRNADLRSLHPRAADDVNTERDVSRFSLASTATSSTKSSLPFAASPSPTSLFRIGGAKATAVSQLSTTGVSATTGPAPNSLNICNVSSGQQTDTNLAISPAVGFFDNQSPLSDDAARMKENAVRSASYSALGWDTQANRRDKLCSPGENPHVSVQSRVSDKSRESVHNLSTCGGTFNAHELISSPQCNVEDTRAGTASTEGIDNTGTHAKSNDGMECSPTIGLPPREGMCQSALSLTTSNELFRSPPTTHDTKIIPSLPEMYADIRSALLRPKELQYRSGAFSCENLPSLCSTAAGSIAAFNTIGRTTSKQIVGQQAGSNGDITNSRTSIPCSTKNVLREASAIALHSYEGCQFEQQGIIAPEVSAKIDELQPFPGTHFENKARVTEAAAQLAGVFQSSAARAGAITTIPLMTKEEKRGKGLDPSAAEFFPSNLALQNPSQLNFEGTELGDGALVFLAQRGRQPNHTIPVKEEEEGGMRRRLNLIAADAAETKENRVDQRLAVESKKGKERGQSLTTERDAHSRSPAAAPRGRPNFLLPLTDMIGEVVHGNLRASTEDLSGRRATSSEQQKRTPLSTTRLSVEEEEASTEDSRSAHIASEPSAENEAAERTEPRIASEAPSYSTRPVNRRTSPRPLSWVSNVLDCSLPTFVTLWTITLVTGLLLSLLVRHVDSIRDGVPW